MAVQSNKFRALCALFDRDYVPNDGPKIPEYDQLLEALKREFGEPRTDLAVQMLQALDAARCTARR